MGGKFPGKFPSKMRVAALFQILILLFFILIVFTRAGMMFNQFYNMSKIMIWFVVGFFVIGSILNLITNSIGEKLIWAPVSIIMLITSLIVAFS